MKKLFFILFFGALYFGVNAQTPWILTGNAGTTSSHFIGTIDKQPLIFKTRNLERMRLAECDALLGIGVTDPKSTLHLHYEANMLEPCSSTPVDGNQTLGNQLLQITTKTTGSGRINGFGIFSNRFKEVTLKQQEEANLYIEGPSGGLTIAPNGNVGVGTDLPLQKFQIGDIWTFHDGFNDKTIGRNTYYNGTNNVRITTGIASRLFFSGDGDIVLQTTPTGSAGTNITKWNTVTMYNNGNVGVGTTAAPTEKLEVNGSFKAASATLSGAINAQSAAISGNLSVYHTSSSDWNYALGVNVNRDLTKALAVKNTTTNKEVFIVYGNGVLSTKKIFAEKIEVTLSALNNYWYDHVFYPEYKLRPLSEVEHFIKQNHHLPEIPSAKEVMENGLDLGEMQGKLLLKIEELTLYAIEQQKFIDAIERRLSEVESKKGGE